MANRNINGDVNVEFTEATSRQGLDSGESVKTLFGKIRKWLSDLKPVAFSGSYNDLTGKPSIPPAVAVKGNAETAYRTGNVNLTAANLGLDVLGYYGIGGRTTNTTTNPWVLVAETTAYNSNNAGITLLFDYTYTPANSATSTGTGILSVSVRTNANGAIITDRSYAKWLTRTNELNNDDVIITYNNSTKSLQIWAESDYAYKIFRVRPLSGSNIYSSFDISKWTFTAALNTNMYASYPTGDGITVLTPTCDIWKQISYNTNKVDKALEQTGYNMIEVPQATMTQAGITYTTDTKAGTITANGTATADVYTDFYIEIPAGTYVYSNSGNTENRGVTGDSFVQLNGTTIARGNANDSPGDTFTITEKSSLRIAFRIINSYTAQNFVFKPMIVPAELAGVPFQPYAKSNVELTQDLDAISEELDCLLIRAALVNNEIVIQNTSDFTNELYSKYFSYTKPKFAILKLQITSSTYYYKALINSSSVSHGNLMEASFITMANGEYIYNFTWVFSGTVGTPTVTRKALNLGN